MRPRQLTEGIYWVGATHWDRRLFDELVPLPDGTSYNAYLVQGSDKTALIDTVDPLMADVLLGQLSHLGVRRLDYVIANHAEQDHSGALPHIVAAYPEARVVTSTKGKKLLVDLLGLPVDRIATVEDGETLSLGNRTLQFIYTPWVHWPETMTTYLPEDRILFSCDFFASHLAVPELFAVDEAQVCEAAKRYYAEIMMPYSSAIRQNLEKLKHSDIAVIAPSHGPVYQERLVGCILQSYRSWLSDDPRNVALVAYVSMHGSTRRMVDHLVAALTERGVAAEPFNLSVTDLGKLAAVLVDAATLVIGSPTVMGGAHPGVVAAVYLTNLLRPKVRFASIIGSYGWGGKMVDQIVGMLPNLKVELLEPVIAQGQPGEADFAALDHLAATIAHRHQENNFR